MVYIEFLRARRMLTWHVGIIALLTVVSLIFAHNVPITVNGDTHPFAPGTPFPLGPLSTIAMIVAAIYASSAATSLNRENQTRDISWTKPIPRTRIALEFIAVDLAAIVIVFFVTLAAIAVILWRLQLVPALDDAFVSEIVLAVGVSVMWYGLIQVLTCMFGPGARSISGILWPVAFVAMGLYSAPGLLGVAGHILDVINPLAYMSGFSTDATGTHANSVWQMPSDERAAVTWLFALLFCGIAVALWPRKEA